VVNFSSPDPVNFSVTENIYKEILADLKSQIASRHSTLDDYKTLNMRCRDLSDLYFLEKRLELIEESLAEKR